jgi:hypothetical protein
MQNKFLTHLIIEYLQKRLDETHPTDIKVELFSFQKNTDGEFAKEVPIENTYRIGSEKYIQAVAEDFIGEYVPLKGLNIIDVNIPLTFLVNVDDVDGSNFQIQDNALIKLNNFARGLVGHNDVLNEADGVNPSYNGIFNAGLTTPNSDPYPLNGKWVMELGIGISMVISTEVLFGNQVKYYLGDSKVNDVIQYQEILPFARSEDRGSNSEPFQTLSTPTVRSLSAKSIIKDNIWTSEVSLHYKQKEIGENNIIERIAKYIQGYVLAPSVEELWSGEVEVETQNSENIAVDSPQALTDQLVTITFQRVGGATETHNIQLEAGQGNVIISQIGENISISSTIDNIEVTNITQDDIKILFIGLPSWDIENYFQNKIWYLKIEYPRFTVEKSVLIESSAIDTSIGELVVMDVVFRETLLDAYIATGDIGTSPGTPGVGGGGIKSGFYNSATQSLVITNQDDSVVTINIAQARVLDDNIVTPQKLYSGVTSFVAPNKIFGTKIVGGSTQVGFIIEFDEITQGRVLTYREAFLDANWDDTYLHPNNFYIYEFDSSFFQGVSWTVNPSQYRQWLSRYDVKVYETFPSDKSSLVEFVDWELLPPDTSYNTHPTNWAIVIFSANPFDGFISVALRTRDLVGNPSAD